LFFLGEAVEAALACFFSILLAISILYLKKIEHSLTF
jgi:hypothetical protein